MVYLCPEEYPETHLRFLEAEGIALHQFGMTGSRCSAHRSFLYLATPPPLCVLSRLVGDTGLLL